MSFLFLPLPSLSLKKQQPTNMQTAPKKVVNAWAMYDWANSAYNLVITSNIFPAYWETITGDGVERTQVSDTLLRRSFDNNSLYNYPLADAHLIVDITSPLLSSIADTSGNKEPFIAFFLTLDRYACAGLILLTQENL